MKFFVDFEALQFSDYIISIGAVSETGKTFSTLVKPPEDKKVTEFITKLTGITDEMLADAPSADSAFFNLFQFVVNRCSVDNSTPEYFCYGNTDVKFIRKTMTKIKNPFAYTFAEALASSIQDYSKNVKQFFLSQDNISLRKVFNLIQEEEVVQHHNALEDAEMLAEVVKKLHTCNPEDKVIIDAMPKQSKPWPASKRAPDIFINWPTKPFQADTGATEDTTWEICAVDNMGSKKYFDTMDTAVLWMIRYYTQGLSPKKDSHKDKVRNRIYDSITNGNNYYNFHFYSWQQAEANERYIADKMKGE